jgi:hypothetical protein
MNLTKRPISDELLRLTVETKIETGTSFASIRELMERFASYHDQRPSEGVEIVGFLGVEDIPLDRRATFLTTLLALADDPNHRSRNLRQEMADNALPATTFPAALLGKAMSFLRLHGVARP